MSENKAPEVNSRVRKKNNPGCQGAVKLVREETLGSSGDTREKSLIVQVQWDNGTLSYFDPESIENI